MNQNGAIREDMLSSQATVSANLSSQDAVGTIQELHIKRDQNLIFADSLINTLNSEAYQATTVQELPFISTPHTNAHRHLTNLYPPSLSVSFAKTVIVKSDPFTDPQFNSDDERDSEGKIRVRVIRNGMITTEAMDPYRLAHLYALRQAALRQVRGEYSPLEVPEWVRQYPFLGAYLAEAFGTFACTLTLLFAVASNKPVFSLSGDSSIMCLPIGFIFMSMISAFFYISGGHFNPALSIAIALVRKLKPSHCVWYIVCQVAAAFVAGATAIFIQNSKDIYVPKIIQSSVQNEHFLDLIYTFIMVFVMLHTGYAQRSGQSFVGLATGMALIASVAAMGSISSGVLNPAVATGLQVALCLAGNCDSLKNSWINWVSPVLGAALAAFIFSHTWQPTEDDGDFDS
ncbi:unnamed protein product [Phytomonas sp. Hart1]|nr:unnamed protein product [Phytomonas sp. Hart1]|eukprot:CCW67713.1 unnamed protein product [Phytomonas sp. isolate Hart1]